ncbi:MAG TPA: FtsW/RodA/SpoVE family cell cycle protein [Niabella sp.]|mgnify:CR=1 FL=1|jgi:cell division protein FtsW (lipid II flippase)/cell division protein FtsI/penicillin-binding protein 2|nr:FtsW/RodA/SpoVE family cell cycle protein [Chitinophagaceae bacterium]HRO84162.1 FtsW/RodA/SpoVE family cell cycle protein [Niabella sp.]
MKNKTKQNIYSRKTERLLLLVVTAILSLMAAQYYFNIEKDLQSAEDGYQSGRVLNLAAPVQSKQLKKLLSDGNYFTDERYVDFITKNLVQKINEQKSLPNLGSLNKKDFMIDATLFTKSGSESGNLRFLNSLAHLGMDTALYNKEQNNPEAYPSVVPVQDVKTGIDISGKIDSDEKGFEQRGILVKLSEIYPDAYWDSLPSSEKPVQTEFYARTDAKGAYKFTNLKKEGNYSVLPIRPGFEFGVSKGRAAITSDQEFDFNAKPHQLRILDKTEYRQIKNDKIFTVRTPSDFKKEFFVCLLIWLIAFWVFHLSLTIKNYRSDLFILPLIMFITGIGLIVLYSVQDPLRDEIYGSGMAVSAAFTLFLASLFIFFFRNNPVNRFYHSGFFDPVHRLLPEGHQLKAPRGYSWLLASILLMLLLAVFGTGPEGSGVKVNLFGFQVSELSKLLMIVFFAAYFAVNADYFRNITNNRWLTKNNMLMLALFVFLLAIYAILGDLGPAIVLTLTFLFLYSFAKEEFFSMIATGVVYLLVLFVVSKFINSAQQNFLPWMSLAACIGSLGYTIFTKKNESIFFIILIISSFILLAQLPFEFTQRLADRNGMFNNMWENKLVGGDQVAHGVWALNSGGFLGQGPGNGFSNVMPAHHTDMMLQSIGEELGFVTIIVIFIAFGILLYRVILSARRTGKPFMFYLMAGIGIATLIQLMLITGGTLGLMPLTGISVPFLSKGNAGIILSLIAFAFIIIMSNEKGDSLEMEYVKKNFDNVNAYSLLFFFGVLIVFSGSLIYYQIKSNRYIVKPALVLNRSGEWQYSYNSRIGIMLREIKPGTIYDRNGIVLATSESTNKKTDSLHNKRTYPFSADLIFWLGDINREIAKEESNGYAAEFRHYTMLRGFDVTSTASQKTSDRFKENRFLPETEKESELVLYDYSALAPYIKAGKNSMLTDAQNKKKKDVYLSLDATLNQKINKIIQSSDLSKNFRTSVIAVNAKTGDVLASAISPMPSYKDLKLISNIEAQDYRSVFKQIFNDRVVVPQDLGITFNSRPGSTVKIIDAFAAMNQYGLGAANFSFFVQTGEIIRKGEPENENVDMHKAIVRSSNVYFIKLANEKSLQNSLFNLYDALGMNILNRGGFHFQKPENYSNDLYFKEWNKFVSKGKDIYKSKKLMGTRKRLTSRFSDLAWGQGELSASPLHLAKMTGAIANNGNLAASRFFIKSWNRKDSIEPANKISKAEGTGNLLSSFMKEQSASVSAATGLTVYGKTGSPERDKLIKKGNAVVRKRVTDAWYTFFVHSPKIGAPVAFTIRIEEVGNSDHAKKLAVEMLKQLKAAGYF